MALIQQNYTTVQPHYSLLHKYSVDELNLSNIHTKHFTALFQVQLDELVPDIHPLMNMITTAIPPAELRLIQSNATVTHT